MAKNNYNIIYNIEYVYMCVSARARACMRVCVRVCVCKYVSLEHNLRLVVTSRITKVSSSKFELDFLLDDN